MKNLNFLKAKSQSKQAIGVELHVSGLTLCMLSRKNKSVIISHAQFEPYENIENETDKSKKISRALNAVINKSDPIKNKCEIVLGAQYYQLLLIEAPSVPDSEIKDAVKWRIKDLVSIAQEHLFIDVFSLPKGTKKTAKNMIYVVVCDVRDLKSIVDGFTDASLEINSINIQEMAIRDFVIEANLDMPSTESVAVVRITKGVGFIFIICDKNIFLSRQFKVNYNGGLLDELPEEAIQVEMQRSLDYYERQMAQSPPKKVLIFGENIYEDKIQSLVHGDLSSEITLLNVDFIKKNNDAGSSEDNDQTLFSGLGALGAALRHEERVEI